MLQLVIEFDLSFLLVFVNVNAGPLQRWHVICVCVWLVQWTASDEIYFETRRDRKERDARKGDSSLRTCSARARGRAWIQASTRLSSMGKAKKSEPHLSRAGCIDRLPACSSCSCSLVCFDAPKALMPKRMKGPNDKQQQATRYLRRDILRRDI